MKDKFDVTALKKPKKKKKINSRAKGNRFENKVAKLLNERFQTEDFCRTPGSGAFATTHKLPKHLQLYGDLITPLKFKFIIECKSGYNEERICDLLNPNSNISNMIATAFRDSKKSCKNFLFIIGQDRRKPSVITNDFHLEVGGDYFRGKIKGEAVIMYSLEDLLNANDSYFLEQ